MAEETVKTEDGAWAEEVDIDRFLHPSEAYIHEVAVSEGHAKKKKARPVVIEDGRSCMYLTAIPASYEH